MRKAVIISDPHILGGKPIIQGTRIAVETILDLLATGMSVKEIHDEYPHLAQNQIKSAILYAATRVRRDKIIPEEMKNGQIVFEMT